MVASSSALDFRAGSDNLKKFAETLDRAGITTSVRDIAIRVGIGAIVLWVLSVRFLHPSLIGAALLLPVSAGLAAGAFWMNVQFKLRKRREQFVQQLELALRLMASGVRIGLGLRQAMAIVIEEMPDPAKHEYMRVIGQTNIGASVYDAMDDLARRMPGNETLMMARAVRIQSQTGGDLGKILEHLANTIKERRRIQRKISALTAEGRAGAVILSALPPFLTAFIALTEHEMGHALLFTTPGHIALVLVAVLETLGVVTLMKMLKVDV